ncbi:MAG: hypothetical protein ACYCYE_19155 [Clostridia bacterium]
MSQNIASIVLNQLKQEVPSNLRDKIAEFETLINSEQYRAAYAVLDELKRTTGWSPSRTLLNYYERFWWELAN